MADAAEKLVEALRALMPPGAPEWVRLSVEATRRGYSTKEFRWWCLRRGITIRKDGREAWVRPADVDRVIDGLDVAKLPPSRAPKGELQDEIDAELDAHYGKAK